MKLVEKPIRDCHRFWPYVRIQKSITIIIFIRNRNAFLSVIAVSFRRRLNFVSNHDKTMTERLATKDLMLSMEQSVLTSLSMQNTDFCITAWLQQS